VSAPGTEVWGYSQERETEGWSGECATREEAIAEGRAEYDGDVFYVIRGTRPKASRFLPAFLCEDIAERMGEAAGEEVGDIVDDWPCTTKEADAALVRLLAAWADEHIPVPFWVADGTPELVPAEPEQQEPELAAAEGGAS